MTKSRAPAAPFAVWMTIFTLVPLAVVVWFAFTDGNGSFTLENIWRIGDYAVSFVRSILIGLVSTLICLVLAYPLAFSISRSKGRVQQTMVMIIMLPMWMNFLLRTYAWQVLLSPSGILNNLLKAVGLPAQQFLYTESAVMLGTVYNFLPFMILPIYTVLSKMDQSQIEAAHDLGANGPTTFFKVVLPLSMPGVISGITMVFIPAITTFAISRLLGGGKFMLYGDLIENQFITLGMDAWGSGSALSFILLVLVLISMAVMRRAEREAGEEGGGKLW